MNRSYEAFAAEPEYLELNRRFIETVPFSDAGTVLDLACGTGTLTFMVQECIAAAQQNQAGSRDHELAVIACDISRESLEVAKLDRNSAHRAGLPAVSLIQTSAEHLPFASEALDLVIIGNAIQLFDNKEAAILDVYRVLRCGGILAFNTSFYAGTFVPGTERFYLNWVQEAYRYVADHTSGGDDQAPRRRRKDSSRPAFSRPWFSKEEYRDLLTQNGFTVQSVTERVALLTEHSFQSIGSYAGLSTILLRGYPPELASEALEKSAGRALASVGMNTIPRNWVEFIAKRD